MRVLHITPGGFHRRMKGLYEYKLCHFLRRRGVDVEVISLGGEPVDNFNVHSFRPSLTPLRLLYRIIHIPFMAKFLNMSFNFDVINAHSTIWSPLSWQAALLNKICVGKPFIVTSHNFYPERELSVKGAFNNFLKKPRIRTLMDGLLNTPFILSDHVICMTHAEKKYLMREFSLKSSKITVIPNGVDLSRFTHRYSFKKKYDIDTVYMVLYAGQLIRLKGVRYFVEMAKHIVKSGIKDVSFVMITHNPKLKAVLLKKAKKLDVDKKLIIFDFNKLKMTDADLIAAYFDCDVVVLPSLIETFPNVILEAMAAGKPVVATDVCGVREIVKDGVTGFLVEPASPNQLADRVIELLTDRDKAVRMGEKGNLAVVEKYTLEKIGEKVFAVYRKVLDAKSSMNI